jgi:hypothetical protein
MRLLFFTILAAAALAGCGRSDPAYDARVQAAMVAGGVALSTINRCLLQMEQASNTAVPECDALEEMKAYESAKQRVKATDVYVLQPLEQKIELARSDAVNAVVRIALQAPR